MKILSCALACVALSFTSLSVASVNHRVIPSNDGSEIKQVTQRTLAGKQQGQRFLSLRSDVEPNAAGEAVPYTKFHQAWSYGRGVGKLPSVCQDGSHSVGLFCADDERPLKLSKKSCAQGLDQQAGLCYQPCAQGFEGKGPLCHGDLANLNVAEVSGEVQEQHARALKRASQPGIDLANGKARLRVDIGFNEQVCANQKLINLVGQKLLQTATGKTWGEIADKIAPSQDIKDEAGETLWVVPGIGDVVSMNLSASAQCSNEEGVSKASLALDSSVRVKVSTKMFDPILHNLGGVGVGAANVSIYELIPFRIYGSVSSGLGMKTTFESIIDENQAPLVIDGQTFAQQTSLSVDPNLDLHLGMNAFVRLPSFSDLIPNLLKLGADVDLTVVDWHAPYALSERLVNTDAGAQAIELNESWDSVVLSGNGRVDPYLSVLGIAVPSFSKNYARTWNGVKRTDRLLEREGVYSL